MARENIHGYIVEVSNYGIGIDTDELEKVFEPGYQGRLRAGEMRPGFGVGLSFVRESVQLHDGVTSIQSHKVANGHAWLTTISVWLPIHGPQAIIEANEG